LKVFEKKSTFLKKYFSPVPLPKVSQHELNLRKLVWKNIPILVF
jgi:hypothetical protein